MDMTLRPLWAATLIAAICVVGAMPLCGLTLQLHDSGANLALAGAMLILYIKQPVITSRPLLCAVQTGSAIMLFAMIGLTGAVASYVAASLSTGYADDALAMVDRMIGFDWPVAYHAEISYPRITYILRIAYDSLAIIPVIILTALTVGKRHDVIRQFITAFALILVMSVIIFPFIATESAIVHFLGNEPDGYMPFTNVFHKAIIDGLRNGMITQVPLTGLVGLIGFPSVHAASSLLYAWAGWQMRAIRLPVMVSSALMLVSTPVEGAHYMIDIVGGLGIAVIAIFAAGARARIAAPASRPLSLARCLNVIPLPRRI